MAKPNTPKSEGAVAALGYTRFGYLARKPTGRTFVPGLKGRPMRGEKWFERLDTIVLHKAGKHGWVHLDRCQQKWVAYCPFHPNDFRGKGAKTLREALVVVAGWLAFTETETFTHTNP